MSLNGHHSIFLNGHNDDPDTSSIEAFPRPMPVISLTNSYRSASPSLSDASTVLPEVGALALIAMCELEHWVTHSTMRSCEDVCEVTVALRVDTSTKQRFYATLLREVRGYIANRHRLDSAARDRLQETDRIEVSVRWMMEDGTQGPDLGDLLEDEFAAQMEIARMLKGWGCRFLVRYIEA